MVASAVPYHFTMQSVILDRYILAIGMLQRQPKSARIESHNLFCVFLICGGEIIKIQGVSVFVWSLVDISSCLQQMVTNPSSV